MIAVRGMVLLPLDSGFACRGAGFNQCSKVEFQRREISLFGKVFKLFCGSQKLTEEQVAELRLINKLLSLIHI